MAFPASAYRLKYFSTRFSENVFSKKICPSIGYKLFFVPLRRSPGNFLSRMSNVDDEAGFFYFRLRFLFRLPNHSFQNTFNLCACPLFSILFIAYRINYFLRQRQ
jgi:hypothetical protein